MHSRSLGRRAPLLWIVLPLIAGLAAGHGATLGPVSVQLTIAGLAGCGAVAASWYAPRAWAPALVVAGFFSGSASYVIHRARLPDWETRPPRETEIVFRINRLFLKKDTRSIAGLGSVVRPPRLMPELVGQHLYFSLRRSGGGEPLARSAVVKASGVLTPLPFSPLPDTFDQYLADAGMNFRFARGRLIQVETPATAYYAWLEKAAGRLNDWLSSGIATKRPDLAAVFRAMMLGQKHELSDEQDTLFMHSGTMHLFAINGLHIGVVALSVHALLALLRFPRPAAALVTLAVLWFDVDTTGASPSAVRAFLLVACYESAVILRRPANGIAALTAAALAVLLIEPMALFSASFQMSYGVVLAILCFGVPLTDHLQERFAFLRDLPKATWSRFQRGADFLLREFWPMIGIGLSAALVSAITGPAFFKTFAPAGFFANLILVPLAMLVIVAGFVSILAGALGAMALGTVFNHAALLILIGIDAAIRGGVKLPAAWWQAQWRVPWAAPAGLVALLGTMLAGYALRWRKDRGWFWPPFVVAAIVVAAGVRFGGF